MLQPHSAEKRLQQLIQELESIVANDRSNKMFATQKHSNYDMYLRGNRSGLLYLALQLLKAANQKLTNRHHFATGNTIKNKHPNNFMGFIELLNAGNKTELIFKQKVRPLLFILFITFLTVAFLYFKFSGNSI